MSKWRRPETVPFPSTWATFEGRREVNGSKRTYWIQDITDEYSDQIVNHMVEEFTDDEPLCKYSKEFERPIAKATFKNIWEQCLKCNLGLVCLTKDDHGKPTIAAMNLTTLCTVDDDEDEDPIRIIDTLIYAKKQADVFNKLNITEFLDAMGLYVLPKYRGEGLGLELLKAREPLCKAVGLTTSITLYSSIISQKLAERAGFKDLFTISYDELEKANSKFRYPGIQEHTKSMRLMYIVYT